MLFGEPVRDRGGNKAVGFDAAVIAAGFDPADQLGNQLPGLAVSAVARVHMDGDRAVQVHLFVFLLILHDPDQLLCDLQAVICLLVKLSSHILNDRLFSYLVEEDPAVSLADYSDHRDDLGLIKVLGVRPNNDLHRRAVLLVLVKKEPDFLRDLLNIQFSICWACEHFPFLLSDRLFHRFLFLQ